jgi:hypothetical protein
MKRLIVLLTALAALLIGMLTATNSVTYAYDVEATARIDVHELEPGDAVAASLSDSLSRSESSPADACRASTAPGLLFVAPNRVIVDTNAVYDRPGTIGALRPGEVPVVTRTTPAEIANNAASGKLKPPDFLNELDVDDVMDVNTRINIRSQLDALRPGQRGLFGDGSIGASAINTGSPVVTGGQKPREGA